jgi:hypothetical protein
VQEHERGTFADEPVPEAPPLDLDFAKLHRASVSGPLGPCARGGHVVLAWPNRAKRGTLLAQGLVGSSERRYGFDEFRFVRKRDSKRMNIFRFVPGYESGIYDLGKEPLFCLFLSFLVAFVLARGYTRIARSRGWGSGTIGGTHLHHVVPGIVLMFLGGVISFTPAASSGAVANVAAVLFGVGGALVLDEFALVFRLKNVYWSNEGRASVTASVMGAMVAGLLLVASSPFDEPDASDQEVSKTAFFTTFAVNAFFALVTYLKGKPYLGTLALFIAPVGWVSAFRLARPQSPWARYFYDPRRGRRPVSRLRKLERSRRRSERSHLDRLARWFVDFIGGKPLDRPSLGSRTDAETHGSLVELAARGEEREHGHRDASP